MDNAEQLLIKAEMARQKALDDLGDLSEFDQRMIAKYGDKYPIRKKAVSTKIENMMVVEPEIDPDISRMIDEALEGLDDEIA